MSKWKERIPGIVISVILVAVFAVFMVILLQSKMVPTKLLILGGIALVLLVASAVLLVRSIRNKGQFICGASLSLVLALVLGLASNYISVATGTLTEIGTVRTEYTPVAVYVTRLPRWKTQRAIRSAFWNRLTAKAPIPPSARSRSALAAQ